MSRLPAVGATGTPSAEAQRGPNDLREVDLDQFLQLLIAELQNQDPLNPMENGEILQQVSQIREIGATNKLSETLDAVLTGQHLTTASSLIGKEVKALTDSGDDVQGEVDRVTVETGGEDGQRTLRVHIGENAIDLKNVREII